jgi:hypothetical protein
VLWTLGTIAVLLLLTAANLLGYIPVWLTALGMASAVVITALRWARFFLVRLVVDLDARNGDGLVIIERLIPAPNLPESQQLPLVDAAEGPTAINVEGLFNNLVTLLESLRFLRILTVGDITFRTKAGEFAMTMYSVQDPEGLKKRIQEDWKKILAYKNKKKAEAERKEEIDRMTIAVAEGIKRARQELQAALVVPPVPVESPASPVETVILKQDEGAEAEDTSGGTTPHPERNDS